MMTDNLEDVTDELLREDNAGSEAIRSLINVAKSKKGEDTEIELKTELTADEVKIHSLVDIFGKMLESDEKQFCSKSIFPMIVEKLERKSLSKGRQSRAEIVNVARQPDMINNEFNQQNDSALKRFFVGRRGNP